MLPINSRPQSDCSVLQYCAPARVNILHEHKFRRASLADFSGKWKYAHVVVQFCILGFNLIYSLLLNVVLS